MAKRSTSSDNSSKSKRACNRSPFSSRDGCNRGEVDIHQFDDLPYCDPIDPTKPSVPPEVIDTPMVLPVPPPCACVDISHKFNFKYGSSFNSKATFSASGDCCGGNYKATFDLQLACPIKNNGEKKITVGIGYGNGDSKKAEPYIAEDSTGCSINPMEPEFDLQIPCPVKISGRRNIIVGVNYGNGDKRKEVPYVNARNDNSCSLELSDATLDLQIPCPIKGRANNKISVGIQYGLGARKITKSYVNKDTSNCSIDTLDADFDLQIPCPIKGGESGVPGATGGSRKGLIKPLIRFYPRKKHSPYDPSILTKRFLRFSQKDCSVSAEEVELDLPIPCPIMKDKESKIKVKTIYKEGNAPSKVFVTQNSEECTIESPDEVEIETYVPCPVSPSRLVIKKEVLRDQENPSFEIKDESSDMCERSLTFKIGFPSGGGGGGAKCLDPISNIAFTLSPGNGLSYQLTRKNLCTEEETTEDPVSIFTVKTVDVITSAKFENGKLQVAKTTLTLPADYVGTEGLFEDIFETTPLSGELCCGGNS